MISVKSLDFQQGLKPNKVKVNESVFCVHCKQDSGWTNSDLVLVPTDKLRDLKCLKCGCVCVKIKTRSYDINEEVNRTIKPYKKKI